MNHSLRGYTTAVLADVAREDLGALIADEVNAVAHLVSRTNDLAVALTDFAVSRSARKAVLQDLLTARIHPVALKMVLRAADTGRVEDFPTVLHELYELARHMHDLDPEELRAEEPIVSRTAWRDYVSGYADAVFEDVPETSELEEIEDELFRFAVWSSRVSRCAPSSPTRPCPSRTGSGFSTTFSEAKYVRPRSSSSARPSRAGCVIWPPRSTGSPSRRRGPEDGGWRGSTQGSPSTPTSIASCPRPCSASRTNPWSSRSWLHPTFSAAQ